MPKNEVKEVVLASEREMGQPKTHVVVMNACGEQPVDYGILNFSDPATYSCIGKELGYRCISSYPDRSGQGYEMRLTALSPANGHTARIRFEGWSLPDSVLLGTLDVPIDRFAWLARSAAGSLDPEQIRTIHVAVTAGDHPLVRQWNCREDDEFALEQSTTPLRLPEISLEPLGPRRVVRGTNSSWITCVFASEVYRDFTQAASAAGPNDHERGWLGQVRVHLDGGRLYVVVDHLVEAPSVRSGRHFVHTSGAQFFQLYQDHSRLGAYLHLHPRDAEGVQLHPQPSVPDTILAWNLDAVVPYPVVMPIAMFGLRADCEGEDLAVSAFCNGTLTAIDWEVLLK